MTTARTPGMAAGRAREMPALPPRGAEGTPDAPITPSLPALRSALAASRAAVLEAPPGAGKTTRVPLALLDEAWLGQQRIVILEPRRLAARAAAAYMARLLGERVGDTVGYRVRLDTRVGPATRIEVVTEGVLARMLRDDPALDGVGLVIFDEFHERSIHADLGLALTMQTQAILRDDLRILVMSATLDTAPVAALLGGAPVVTSAGRAFPVETRHVARRPEQRLEAHVAAVVRTALARDDGDILVFLPGVAEIGRVAAMLGDAGLPPEVRVLSLHGTLALEQQDEAIAPSRPGHRKVVLATSIAETSLTIAGVRVVIDAGLVRAPRFSPASGMTRLETRRVSRASADQRRGRAGREAPGVAWRLWAEHEEGHLVAHATPEILEADLAPVALALAEAGVADPGELAWLDPPPAAAYAQARELLVQLGALDGRGVITEHGGRMAALPMHPRLAHMLLAAPPGHSALACDIAALLGERDVLRGDGGPPDADLRLRLEAMRAAGSDARSVIHGMTVDRDALRRARTQSGEWQRRLGAGGSPRPGASGSRTPSTGGVEHAGILLALAYPDRIAQRRGAAGVGGGGGGGVGVGGGGGGGGGAAAVGTTGAGSDADRAGRFLLRNGRGAVLSAPQALSVEPYIVIAELDDRRPESRIFLAAPVSLEELLVEFADQVVDEAVVEFSAASRAVVGRRRTRLGALVLADAPLRDIDPALIEQALVVELRARGIDALPWTDGARRLRERIAFLGHHAEGWPDVSGEALAATMDEWLTPHLAGLRKLDDIARLDVASLLRELLDWKQRAALDELAPTHIVVPSGSRIPVDYSSPEAPVLAVRLQEMFGCMETPRIAGGRVPLTVHLLSPANRPVQVTRDLAGFWRTSYHDVRKDMRGRYPKHQWPEDPAAGVARKGIR